MPVGPQKKQGIIRQGGFLRCAGTQKHILNIAVSGSLSLIPAKQEEETIARVVEGKAEMIKNQILTDGEIEDGFILTCQAQPLTPILKVDYDDV